MIDELQEYDRHSYFDFFPRSLNTRYWLRRSYHARLWLFGQGGEYHG